MSISKIMNMVMNSGCSISQKCEENGTIQGTIDNILTDLEYYMLNHETLTRLENSKNEEILISFNSKKQPIVQKSKEEFFSPKQKDGLFWCFFVLKNGEAEYELINNYKITLVKEKKIKIDYVEKFRKEKTLFKKPNLRFASLSHIENQLVNESVIDVPTFLSLCLLEKINVLYTHRKTYFELVLDEKELIHLVQRIDEPSRPSRYVYQGTQLSLLENYRKNLFKVENIEKPIKAVSSYKVAELMDFCQKLSLEISYHDEKTAKIKNKSKQALYEAIVQSLYTF